VVGVHVGHGDICEVVFFCFSKSYASALIHSLRTMSTSTWSPSECLLAFDSKSQ